MGHKIIDLQMLGLELRIPPKKQVELSDFYYLVFFEAYFENLRTHTTHNIKTTP